MGSSTGYDQVYIEGWIHALSAGAIIVVIIVHLRMQPIGYGVAKYKLRALLGLFSISSVSLVAD